MFCEMASVEFSHVLQIMPEKVFVGYTNITKGTTVKDISDPVLARLQSIGLDPSNIRAQAYDGTCIYFQDDKRLM